MERVPLAATCYRWISRVSCVKCAELAWLSCSSRPFSWTMRNPLYKKPTSPKLLPLWIGLPSRIHIIATHALHSRRRARFAQSWYLGGGLLVMFQATPTSVLHLKTPILPRILAASAQINSAQINDRPPLSGLYPPLGRAQRLLLQPAASSEHTAACQSGMFASSASTCLHSGHLFV